MARLVARIYFLIIACFISKTAIADISVPFELVNGLIIIKAEIDGKTGNYIVDSGANGILLNKQEEASSVSFQTLSSTLEGSESNISTFKVGKFEVHKLQGFSTDLSDLEIYLEKSIDGILGCSVFTPKSLIFDFVKSELVISDQRFHKSNFADFNRMKFQIIDDIPIVKLKIGGKKHAFILDSGASCHFIDQRLLIKKHIDYRPTGVEKIIITASDTNGTSREYELLNCTMGAQTSNLIAFEKDFSQLSSALGTKIDGLLSLSTLSAEKLYFDLNSKTLFFD